MTDPSRFACSRIAIASAALALAAAACAEAPAPAPPASPTPPPAAAATSTPTSASPGARGAACSPASPCSTGLTCAPLPHGYCSSFCGLAGTACDGACVETGRAGEVCLKRCASDDDCRKSEGYVCDPDWKGCMPPNMGAIVPKRCPPGPGPGRDAAFGASERFSTSAAPGLFHFEPSAVVTADGGVVAMFVTRGAMGQGNLLAVSRVDGKGKSMLDAPFKTDREGHFDPWLSADRSGVLYAVWLGMVGRGEHQVIGLATSSDRGATWSAPGAAQDPSDCKSDERDCLDKPMIAVGPDPRKKESDIVYVMYSAGETGLRVRSSRDGGKTFGAATTALAGIYGNAAVGADGRLHIATVDGGPKGAYGSTEQRIEYTVSADAGASFAKVVRVSAPGESIPFFFSNASVAVDDKRGWVYVAYARGDRSAKWDLVVAASKDRGATWSRTTLGDGCSIHMVPNLAIDPTTGTLHVAWYDSAGAAGRFAHATCAAGAASCAQQGAVNDVPFAALSTVRHGAKWVGEYEGLLVDDRRRVLHAVWSQPVDEDKKVVGRIFHASAKLAGR